MTRWARGGPANKKKPLEASSWSELSKHDVKSKSIRKQRKERPVARHGTLTTATSEAIANIKQTTKGLSEGDVQILDEVAKKDKRREARRLRRVDDRVAQKVCYGCRQPGHALADCPTVVCDDQQAVDICFKCGSTEHGASQCSIRVPQGTFPFATCFICKEAGHLSKQCPDNPRGLYPKGGCCRICSSVEHFKKDCPELQRQQKTDVQHVQLTRLQNSQSADDEMSLHTVPVRKPAVKKGPKIVKF